MLLVKPPRLDEVTLEAALRRVDRETGAVKFSLASIMYYLDLGLVQGHVTLLQGRIALKHPRKLSQTGQQTQSYHYLLGYQVFLPQIIVFIPQPSKTTNFLAAQVFEPQNLR